MSYSEKADDIIESETEKPISIEEFAQRVEENPDLARHSAQYILDSIESMGTRTVVEQGEEIERYQFFDDPSNDGEHAILGNTKVLNNFVETLRSVASGRGKDEKMIWISGPTATGKSEFKRCLINGLKAYSKTEEGKRYTLEWNIESARDRHGIDEEENWYESPVQINPLSVFPEKIRHDLLSDSDIEIPDDLDPFSREAYNYLEKYYLDDYNDELFSHITDNQHLRVSNYIVDEGQGIGVLHSEDAGNTKQRLVGSWMKQVLAELDSKGEKDARAFSYDGILSQGNGVVSIVEDAIHHSDLLQKLLNVADESAVKLDKGIKMDIDTLILAISNPDLESKLNQQSQKKASDPLKALKRRMEKHSFKYLTNLSLEAELLRREITQETGIWTSTDYSEIEDNISAPLYLNVRKRSEEKEREIARFGIETGAIYDVISRLKPHGDLDLIEKAKLYDKGHIQREDERIEIDDILSVKDDDEGENGIPATYTRDVIADLINDGTDRDDSVILPRDIISEICTGLENDPLFSDSEVSTFEKHEGQIISYIEDKQEEDILDAMMAEKKVDYETIEEYVTHVFAWVREEKIETDRGDYVDPDPLKMKVFEINHLGWFGDGDYYEEQAKSYVAEFRQEEIVNALTKKAWDKRSDEFDIDDFDVRDIPIIKRELEGYDWADIKRKFEDFDPDKWENPPEGTTTEELKEKTIENMVEMQDYSERSAELVTRKIIPKKAKGVLEWGE